MRKFLPAALAVVSLYAPLQAAAVRTIAGTGQSGYSGDGGAGTKAQLANPYGLTRGPDGALYLCEVDNHRIRRLDLKTGAIATVAGTGERGYAGDGGPALQAKLNEPYEIRFDAAGNMYFVEMRNHLVRRVDAKTRAISTVAGTGVAGFSGDGGPAVKAQFQQPHSIALDGKGLLYVADIGNHRVRRVNLATGIIETFAGTGEKARTPDGAAVKGTPLNGPRTIAFSRDGDMFLALREGNAVFRIDMQKLTIHHIAGTGEQGYTGDGGPAKLAKLSGPKGIAVAPDGSVLIADTESHTIRRIDLKTGTITTVAGDGTRHDGPDGDPLKCGLARPHGIFVDTDGKIYIGDSENHRVRVVE
jgi:DNA-binding beta-propeller fold protein YncE